MLSMPSDSFTALAASLWLAYVRFTPFTVSRMSPTLQVHGASSTHNMTKAIVNTHLRTPLAGLPASTAVTMNAPGLGM